MDFNEYQVEAMSFRLPSADNTYALLNLSGEVGELHSLIAKAIRDGAKDDFFENVRKELGDILWCLAAVAHDQGHSLEEIAQANIDKLSSRSKRNQLQGSGDDR